MLAFVMKNAAVILTEIIIAFSHQTAKNIQHYNDYSDCTLNVNNFRVDSHLFVSFWTSDLSYNYMCCSKSWNTISFYIIFYIIIYVCTWQVYYRFPFCITSSDFCTTVTKLLYIQYDFHPNVHHPTWQEFDLIWNSCLYFTGLFPIFTPKR